MGVTPTTFAIGCSETRGDNYPICHILLMRSKFQFLPTLKARIMQESDTRRQGSWGPLIKSASYLVTAVEERDDKE